MCINIHILACNLPLKLNFYDFYNFKKSCFPEHQSALTQEISKPFKKPRRYFFPAQYLFQFD